jgi:hypothetical protein
MNRRFHILLLLVVAVVAPGIHGAGAETLGSATLTWTAPGDDSLVGTASLYDIRFSLEPINEETFVYANRVAMVRPSRAGTRETYTVTGLLPGYDYYFAIRTADDVGNWSRVSNLAFRPGRAIGLEAQAPKEFALSAPWPNPVRDHVNFTLTMPRSGTATVDVFDMSGRRVQRIAGGYRSPGQVRVVWRLVDGWGRKVGPGMYMVRAQLEGKEIVRRMSVIP